MQADLFIKASEQASWASKTLQESSGLDGVVLINAVDAVTLVGINVPGRKVISLVNRGDSAVALTGSSTEVGAAYRFSANATIPAYGEIRLVSNDNVGWVPIAVSEASDVLAAANLYADSVAASEAASAQAAAEATAATYADEKVVETITNGNTDTSPSENAVFDALALKQNALTGTYSLGNFTDPGDATASAAMGGAVGALIFGYVTATPDAAVDEIQTFAVETTIASGVYTTVLVAGLPADPGTLTTAISNIPFSFFVPTGRKWKHTKTGNGALISSISGIVL